MRCSLCGTTDFSVVDGSGATHLLPLRCEVCQIVVCFGCTSRYYDHSGVKMLCCPQCGRRGELVEVSLEADASQGTVFPDGP
jgi:hypothetical protein